MRERMKIAFITPYWKNSPGGGGLSYLTGLIAELENKGIGVVVIFKEGVDKQNYLIKGNKFLFAIRAFWLLRRIKPEVVHSQGSWYCLMGGFLYKKIYGVKLIHTFHSSPGNRKSPIYEKILMQFLLNRCDYTTFVSKMLKYEEETIEGLRFKKAAITYAGITPTEVLESEMKEFYDKFGLKDNSIVLLAQSLTANKLKAEGARLLIKAIGILKDKYPDIVLMLTREAVYSNELKHFTRESGLGDRVIFTGDVENPYIPLTICDIYTHISLSEGVPMALLEAMSIGKPIIATSIGGIPEVISSMKNGILIEPDIEEIVKAIELLLVNKELAKKLGVFAKITCDQKFTRSQCANRFIELYNST